MELNSILFSRVSNTEYSLLDLNYGMALGHLRLEEGPGWVLDNLPTFLDMGHMSTILKFVGERTDS